MLKEKPMERVERIKNECISYLIEVWGYSTDSAEQEADIKVGYYEDAILFNPYFELKEMFKF